MTIRPGVVALTAVVALTVGGTAARAGDDAPVEDRTLLVDARPIAGTTLDQGGDEIYVEITNTGDKPRRGSVEVSRDLYGNLPSLSTGAFSVAAGATASLHLPIASDSPVRVVVRDEAGVARSKTTLASSSSNWLRVLDVEEVSRLGTAIGSAPLDPDYRVLNGYSGYSTAPLYLQFATVRNDRATGDPILPEYASGWRSVHLALMKSDTLGRLGGATLEALESYVLGGGTLAVVVTHPEDLRQPTLEALVGGDATKTRTSSLSLAPLVLLQAGGVPQRWTTFPASPADEVEVWSYAGGNLEPTPYGAAAAYGLGEVVLLGFDPTTQVAAVDPWVQVRVADLAQRAYERNALVVFGPASQPVRPYTFGYEDPLQEVRRRLDPNQSARCAIGVATGILCVYAILAGPWAFWRARRKKKPLRALWALPGYSAAAFALVVGVGVISKGSTSRSRRLTLVDAGAGMTRAVAHRFRGFFSGSATELTVVAQDRTAVLTSGSSEPGYDSDTGGTLVVDHDGARLEHVAAIPWQTVLVDERGLAKLGGGISVTASEGGTSHVIVKNRTGKALRGVVIRLPNEEVRYAGRIEDGKAIDTRDLPHPVPLATWAANIKGTQKAGRADVHGLGASWLAEGLRGDEPEIGASWIAAQSTVPSSVDWFPRGVPVVLAAIDGGEGRTSDSGMKVDADTVLVRVVGFGGEP